MKIGSKYKVQYLSDDKTKPARSKYNAITNFIGMLTEEHERYYLFETKKYKTTVLKSVIKCGECIVQEV